MRLPRSLALTYSEAGSDPRLLTLVQRVPAELWSMRLALALLEERARGEESDWAPYIALLPASYPGCPLFWSGEDLQELQYPPLAAQVRVRRSDTHVAARRNALRRSGLRNAARRLALASSRGGHALCEIVPRRRSTHRYPTR